MLDSMPFVVDEVSPTGFEILAQGKAQRLPWVCHKHDVNCPEGAEQSFLLSPFRATFGCLQFPGRRFAMFHRQALPWAVVLLPHSGRKLYDHLQGLGEHNYVASIKNWSHSSEMRSEMRLALSNGLTSKVPSEIQCTHCRIDRPVDTKCNNRHSSRDCIA